MAERPQTLSDKQRAVENARFDLKALETVITRGYGENRPHVPFERAKTDALNYAFFSVRYYDRFLVMAVASNDVDNFELGEAIRRQKSWKDAIKQSKAGDRTLLRDLLRDESCERFSYAVEHLSVQPKSSTKPGEEIAKTAQAFSYLTDLLSFGMNKE